MRQIRFLKSCVARRARVSIATASLALRGRPGISARTRERVHIAAATLKYAPRACNGARSRRTLRFAFVCNLSCKEILDAPYTAALLAGCAEAAATANASIVYKRVPNDGDGDVLAACLPRGMTDGIIVLTYCGLNRYRELLDRLLKLQVPIVVLDSYCPLAAREPSLECEVKQRENVYRVRPDNIGGMENLVAYLHGLGHRRMATLVGERGHPNIQERLAGMRMALQQRGLELPDSLVAQCSLNPGGGAAQATEDLLRRGASFTALLCQCDSMAPDAMRVLKRHGRRVPQDVSLTGFDDIALAAHLDPPLTTVQANMAQMGMTAVELLSNTIASGVFRPLKVAVPGELVIRESCVSPRSPDV